MTHNSVQRFLFDDLDIRGAVVHLGSVWKQLLANRNYPAQVVELLGQMSITTLLLADNLKHGRSCHSNKRCHSYRSYGQRGQYKMLPA